MRFPRLRVAAPFALPLLLALGACNDHEAKTPQKGGDGVPANSLSDARLHGANEDGGYRSSADPTQPYIMKVGDAPPPSPPDGDDPSDLGSPSPGAPAAKAGKPAPAGKGAVSKAECDKVMDRYLSLEISSNPQLKDVGPEIIEQAKQMMRQQHGATPCTATRPQYTCAMAATTTAAWQRCMK